MFRITGHRDDGTVLLQLPNEGTFVFRTETRSNVVDFQFLSDSGRRFWIVARGHDHLDAQIV